MSAHARPGLSIAYAKFLTKPACYGTAADGDREYGHHPRDQFTFRSPWPADDPDNSENGNLGMVDNCSGTVHSEDTVFAEPEIPLSSPAGMTFPSRTSWAAGESPCPTHRFSARLIDGTVGPRSVRAAIQGPHSPASRQPQFQGEDSARVLLR